MQNSLHFAVRFLYYRSFKFNFMRAIFFSSKHIWSVLVFSVIIFVACNDTSETETTTASTDSMASTDASPATTSSTTAMVNHAEATLSGTYADTTVTGKVEFHADSSGKVIMNLDITVPAKAGKSVAVHLHEHGNCGDTAMLAHGHWNPTNAQHGKWGSSSYHAGDIGNIKLDSKGNGKLSITTDMWTLGGDANKNIIGKAVIVHSGMDDYKTQPTGNSGGRIGCGVIQ